MPIWTPRVWKPRAAFRRTPNLEILSTRVEDMKVECPDFVLMGDAPFMVKDDGSICGQPLHKTEWIPRLNRQKKYRLEDEFEPLATVLLMNSYDADQLEYLEMRAASLLETVEKSVQILDGYTAVQLRGANLLN